jgi:hypothetical protein
VNENSCLIAAKTLTHKFTHFRAKPLFFHEFSLTHRGIA